MFFVMVVVLFFCFDKSPLQRERPQVRAYFFLGSFLPLSSAGCLTFLFPSDRPTDIRQS
jgi:hypothetical protein